MPNKLQPLRGTKDLLPPEFKVHEFIIQTAKDISGLYGYKPMCTPIIEYTKVFDRTLGDTSDVVSKEMYTFLSKGNDSISLRPEFTAGIMRSFISNGLQHTLPLKFFSYGPSFRYSKPQQGRYRQFHQLNFEYIGAEGPYTDAEVIKLAQDILSELGVLSYLTLEINSLGCNESRMSYQKKLYEYFLSYKTQLSEDSVTRLNKNPMRILDSKDEGDQKIAQNAPVISEHYTDSSKRYFDDILRYLDLLKVQYTINPRLVRGLDYYCHTAFEYIPQIEGNQSSVLGGGRYDGLAKIMGGPDTKAIGFGAGIERLALLKEYVLHEPRQVIVMPIDENTLDNSLLLADRLRAEKIRIKLSVTGKLAKRIQKSLDENAKYIIFIGEDEVKNNNFKVKDLDNRQELLLDFNALLNFIKSS